VAQSKAQKTATTTLAALQAAHPDAHCELDHGSPFELIVATVLSAQSTDVAVNLVTPELFRRWPTPASLALADASAVELVLGRLGMFRQKAKNVIGLAKRLVEVHAGVVPRALDELVALPGVGRKTANVVLGVAFGAPEGVVVDTHVQRISQRLGWTKHTTPDKIELDLMRLFSNAQWDNLSHTLIFHGRRICSARKPACAACPINASCPNAFAAEQVGRKPAKRRTVGVTTTADVTAPAKASSAKASSTKASSAKASSAKASSAKRALAPRTSKSRHAQAKASSKRRVADTG
jgi:endonuclease-3